jgi:hypothetical protein
MQINPELKQRIQLVMAVAVLVSGTRLAYILFERHETQVELAKKAPPPLNPDYYVTPKKLYLYDLKSARQLSGQTVWAKVGYAYTLYPYDPASGRVDFSHEAGKLLPLEKFVVKDVVTDAPPQSPRDRQAMAVFEREGKSYSFAIGSVNGDEYKFYADDMLFTEDPRELYKHWPADVWDAIDKRQVKPGMSELQADFAIGLGIPEKSGSPGNRTVNYPNGGNALNIVYQNDRATAITPAPDR